MRNGFVLVASCLVGCVAMGCGDDDGGGGGSGNGRISFSSTCPAPAACGGDLVGTWSFDGACLDEDLVLGALQMDCPGASVTDIDGRVTGTLTATATTIERNGNANVNATVSIPASCTMGIACTTLSMYLQSSGVEGSCRDAAGGCSCTISAAQAITDSTTYTTSGNTLTTGEGETYEYCVRGDTLTYQETGAEADPGTFTLVR